MPGLDGGVHGVAIGAGKPPAAVEQSAVEVDADKLDHGVFQQASGFGSGFR